MKKRGQLLGMPFTMIFALVVGAMILIGGLYYVLKLTSLGEEVSIAKEINDFKAVIQTYYYLEEGNSKSMKLTLPAKAKNVCFYDSARGWSPGTGKGYPADLNTYKGFMTSFKEKNMFVFPTKEFEESAFQIPNLKLTSQANNPVCAANGQNIKILSKGDHVEVQAQ